MKSLLAGVSGVSLVFLIVGAAFAPDQSEWCLGVILGAAGAVFMAMHMYRSFCCQMDMDDENGHKYMIKHILFRFLFMAVLLYMALKTEGISLAGVFAGMFALKISALLQPCIHKKLLEKERRENGR